MSSESYEERYARGESRYPYYVGPTFAGTPEYVTEATIPAEATQFVPPAFFIESCL